MSVDSLLVHSLTYFPQHSNLSSHFLVSLVSLSPSCPLFSPLRFIVLSIVSFILVCHSRAILSSLRLWWHLSGCCLPRIHVWFMRETTNVPKTPQRFFFSLCSVPAVPFLFMIFALFLFVFLTLTLFVLFFLSHNGYRVLCQYSQFFS